MARSAAQLRAIFAKLREAYRGKGWYGKVARGIGAKKYGGEKPSQAVMHHVMGKFKRGSLHDKAGKVVKNRSQAIAIALSTRARMGLSK